MWHVSACTSDAGYHSLAGAQNLLEVIQDSGFKEVLFLRVWIGADSNPTINVVVDHVCMCVRVC